MEFIRDPSLVLYLPLWKLDGSSFADRSAYGHLCSVSGALWTPHGRSFDGVNDYVDCGNDASLNITDAITLEIWVKPNILPFLGWDKIIKKNINFGLLTDGYGMRAQTGSNDIQIWVGNGSVGSIGKISLTQHWSHIVMVYKSGVGGKVYVNGVERTTLVDIGDIDPVPGIPFLISDTVQSFNGFIDEVRIYKRALSGLEIMRRYIETKDLHRA